MTHRHLAVSSLSFARENIGVPRSFFDPAAARFCLGEGTSLWLKRQGCGINSAKLRLNWNQACSSVLKCPEGTELFFVK